MNESGHSNRLISEKNSSAVSQKDKAVATSSRSTDDQPTAPRSTSRERPRLDSLRISMRKYFNAFKSHILSSEDDSGFQFGISKDCESAGVEREPMFVIVDSSCASNPSSKELLIDTRNYKTDAILRRYFNKNNKPADTPSTSKDLMCALEIITPQIKESESRDELQMIDINLQSENDISLDDPDPDNESIVISYLKNKDALLDIEGTLLSTKKKSSLLESVPKMETILEGEQFDPFLIYSTSQLPSQELIDVKANRDEIPEENIVNE